MRMPKGKACVSLKTKSCEYCNLHYDGRKQNDENGKCVWVPRNSVCNSMEHVKRENLTYDEDCKGKRNHET